MCTSKQAGTLTLISFIIRPMNMLGKIFRENRFVHDEIVSIIEVAAA
jgi:hypothetical protein